MTYSVSKMRVVEDDISIGKFAGDLEYSTYGLDAGAEAGYVRSEAHTEASLAQFILVSEVCAIVREVPSCSYACLEVHFDKCRDAQRAGSLRFLGCARNDRWGIRDLSGREV